MRIENIHITGAAQIETDVSINNVRIGNGVKIARRCSIYGSPDSILQIGEHSYIGMNCIINGWAAQISIGRHVSMAQNVNIMADSGPNASPVLQQVYPLQAAPVTLGDHCWIGASAIIMPGVSLGQCCVVAANSFVDRSFPDFSVIGGAPARLLKTLDPADLNRDIVHD